MSNIPHPGEDLQLPPASGQADLSAADFDGHEDDWYIMLRAHEAEQDPLYVLQQVRASQRNAALAQSIALAAQPMPTLTTSREGQGGTDTRLPPGFAGELAQFIYDAAPRPVAEVAVVGALGLLAGICGREWNVSRAGLNVYIVLVARSGVGKEAMHSGVSMLVKAVLRASNGSVEPYQFVCFDDFVSGPALVKGCLHRQSFVNVAGEIGHKFRSMADDNDPNARTLRKQMTTLYSKSGRDDTAGGLLYSSAEASVAGVSGVAYSLIGESTPRTFFEALTPAMMEDGFMSRFNVVEYTGDRPPKNPRRAETPPEALVQRLIDLMSQAITLRLREEVQPVTLCGEAAAQLDDFDLECDEQIRAAGDDESRRQMWSRAHLKALRMAALLAVADNHLNPVVSDDHAAWALSLVRADIAVFSKRISSGEIGAASDDAREAKLATIIREYIRAPSISPGYKVPKQMHEDGLIPRHYLQMRISSLPAFKEHKLGTKRALDDALRGMVENGWLMEVKSTAAVEAYDHHGKTYRVLGLPD